MQREHADLVQLTAPPALASGAASAGVRGSAGLLSRISLETSRDCNLRCIYCYARSGRSRTGGLSDADIRHVIREAVALGMQKVFVVGGGEPLLRPSMTSRGESPIEFANSLGCYCCLYTNAVAVDGRVAQWLADREVSVVAKLNSLRANVQDRLAGVPGSAKRIMEGIEALIAAGLNKSSPSRLGLQTVVCRQNYDEIPRLWHWMRQRNIIPEVEIPKPQGRARENKELLSFPDSEAPGKYKDLFEELLRIDRIYYRYDWIPHPPFAAISCDLCLTGCYVNEDGGVQLCAGVEHEYGYLRVGRHGAKGATLREILQGKEFHRVRDLRQHLTQSCKGCQLLDVCYGCRGVAWNITGDVFGPDPTCWLRPTEQQRGEAPSAWRKLKTTIGR